MSHSALDITTQNIYASFLDTQLFSQVQSEILHEVGEIRLDFTPIQSTKTRFLEPKIAVVGSGKIVEEFLDSLSRS